MSRFKLPLIFAVILVLLIGIFIYYKYTNIYDYEDNIKTYAKFLVEDPDNCFYNEQIAANYSALCNFDKAIKHYRTVITNCPDNLLSIFQLGVCYYLNDQETLGLKFMNEAIEKARIANDKKLEEMFKKEKSDWIKKKPEDWKRKKVNENGVCP